MQYSNVLVISLIIFFIGLIVYYGVNNTIQEGLENSESDKSENNQSEDPLFNKLLLSNRSLKKKIEKMRSMNLSLNNELDVLENKINCKNSKNNSASDATNALTTQISNQKSSAMNFSLSGI